MRKYHMQDRSAGYVASDDPDLYLVSVFHMSDWTAEQFDMIASMQVNDERDFDGIWIKRTE